MPLTCKSNDENDGDVDEEELEVSQVAENLQILEKVTQQPLVCGLMWVHHDVCVISKFSQKQKDVKDFVVAAFVSQPTDGNPQNLLLLAP